VEPPRLETERLILRPFQGSDYEPYLRAHQRPEVVKYITADGNPLDEPTAWRSLAMFAGHWVLRGFGSWAVEERSSGKWIGRVGLHRPEPWPEVELGYMIDVPYWRQGFAVEACRASMQWAKDTLSRTRLVSYITPGNEASVAVAKKLGGIYEKTFPLQFHDAQVFGYRL
jgi:RimJ/RimL family protein N-acetyltransferase